jgi:hypothetical protein
MWHLDCARPSRPGQIILPHLKVNKTAHIEID